MSTQATHDSTATQVGAKALLLRAMPLLLALALTVGASSAGILVPLDQAISELRTQLLAARVDSDVVIVAIDAQSLRVLNQWPWARDVHARLLTQLDQAQPRAVFFDIDFSVRSGNDQADHALAEAFAVPRRYPVVLPAFWQKRTAAYETSTVLTEPLPELLPHSKIGLVNVFPDEDGLVRRALHKDRFGQRTYTSAAMALLNRSDLVASHFYPIDYRIAPASFTYVSYADVLSGAVPVSVLADKTVFVGATAIELGDNIPVPVYSVLPGVVVQATIYETLRRSIPVPVPPWASGLMLVLIAGLWLRYWDLSWRKQFLLLCVSIVVLTATTTYLYAKFDWLLEIATPLLLMLACVLASIVTNSDRQALQGLLVRMRLTREKALVSGVLAASIDGILIVDLAGCIQDANAAAAGLMATSLDHLRGRELQEFLPGLATRQANGRVVDALHPGRIELKLTIGNKNIPVEVSISPSTDETDGQVLIIVRDVRERYRQQAVLRHQATHDSLTGLPNRNLLGKYLERLGHQESHAALFMLDLDGFKNVNDTLGHQAGDEILRDIGKRMRRSLSAAVRVFRIGGDEFAALVLADTSNAALTGLAQEILRLIREPVTVANSQIELGGSIGVARYPQQAQSGELLLQCADVAMYSAKSRRSGVEFYDAEADHHSLRNLKLMGALRKALAAEELTMVYQPKIDLHSGRCIGVEALVRWCDDELGHVSPAEFIPIAETCDLIGPLTRFTLGRALRDHARWCARGLDIDVAVNLSARHVMDTAFAQELVSTVEHYGVDPRHLELEITETALMENPDKAQAVLSCLTDKGIRLAMDDFGTGFSSLAYLKYLNLHTLKIDRCFIQDLRRDGSDQKIVASTLSMAHSLGLRVVAEGVETDEQASLLAEMGCDIGQGFGLAKPMGSDVFVAWCLDRVSAKKTVALV